MAQVYSFPDLALAHLTIRATDTFTSLPEFTGIYRGVIIPVPSNHVFNEATSCPSFRGCGRHVQDAYTNNPAWHAYNLIKNARYGKNAYYPEVPDQWITTSSASTAPRMASGSTNTSRKLGR